MRSVLQYVVFITIVSTTIGKNIQRCTCNSNAGLKCENLRRTAIMDTEVCDTSAFYLAGNKLRTFPTYFSPSFLDISDNEIGKGNFENEVHDLLSRVTEFYINKNSLTSFNFWNKSQESCLVKFLDASDNLITELEDIRLCERLTTLRLANNKIQHIPEKAFTVYSWQEKMLYMDLSGNPIKSISPEAFSEMNSLLVFSLNNTGVLSELPPKIFKGFYVLEKLFLNGNQFRVLPDGVFSGLEKLNILHLQDNKLEMLSDTVFDHLGNLVSLDLDDNALEVISSRTFSRLHQLAELSVRNNRLKTIPSLRECGGPLLYALFSDNDISYLDEDAVRALLRYGFELGDITYNPVDHDSVLWWKNTSDIYLHWNTWEERCGNLSLLRAEGHGTIQFCVEV